MTQHKHVDQGKPSRASAPDRGEMDQRELAQVAGGGTDGNDTIYGTNGKDTIWGDTGGQAYQQEGGDDYLYGGRGDDSVEGGDGRDFLTGDMGNDTLDGGDGHDYLMGGSGDDLLQGGSGDDILDGGTGDDTLAGGEGDDDLQGGAGADLFVFQPDDGDDTIGDFDPAEDRLEFSGLTWDDLSFATADDGSTVISYGQPASTVTLDGVTLTPDQLRELIDFT